MFIVVTLRDHEDKSHNSVKLVFESEATIQQLQDKILTSFQVAIRRQEIFERNARRIDLLNGSLENAGLRDNETLILARFAKRGFKNLIDLENCEFFETYPSFADKFVELSTVFDRFIIGVEENIKIAVGSYFRKYFANEALSITFSPKPGQRLDHPSLNMIIQNWKLLENFTKATESIANDCKRMENIIWRDGYDEYLKVVLENIKLFNNML